MDRKLASTLIAAASALEAVEAAASILEMGTQPDLPDPEIVQPTPEKPPLGYVPILHHMVDDTWALSTGE